MPDEKKKKKKGDAKEVSTKIYGRVRGLMPWEPKKVSLQVMANKIRNKCGKVTNEYSFERVFKPTSENRELFKVIVLPMISNVLKGFNAVLIAYGQTGSGKTYSMLGKPRIGVVGLLPMMLENVATHPSVTSLSLCAVEAFGHHVMKVELFDLFDELNQVPQWSDKKGDTGLDMMRAISVPITDADDAHKKIVFAHAASHFAPTGKNPESSRGHVTFVAKVVQQKGKHESLVSYFVMVDCAGSEGESAFTEDFKSRVTKETLIARRLEAGTINTGLSQLQVIFNQLRTKGELTKAIGNGLRRVLHPYINTNTYLSVLFNLSPSITNCKSTESTLKFAVTAGMVKVKPLASRGKVNWDQLIKELKVHIEQQEKVVEDNNDSIETIERKINRTQEAINRTKRGEPKPKKKREKLKKMGASGGGGLQVSVTSPTTGDVDDSGNGGTPPEFMDRSPRTQPAQFEDEVADALMNVLDDSILELMTELDEEFKNELEAEQLKVAEAGGPPADEDGTVPEHNRMLSHGYGRHRAVTAEENDMAMKQAMKAFSASQKLAPPKPKKKAESRVEKISKQLELAEKDYQDLKNVKLDELEKEDMMSHAMDLSVLLNEQKSICTGLRQSKAIIVEYLRDDGREALIQWFRMRKILDKDD